MESDIESPEKLENRTDIWTNNPTSGYLFKWNATRILKRQLHSHVHGNIIHTSIIHTSSTMQPKYPSMKWVNIEDDDDVCVYTHINKGMFRLTIEGNPVICNNMDEPGGQYGSLDNKWYLVLVKNVNQKIFLKKSLLNRKTSSIKFKT